MEARALKCAYLSVDVLMRAWKRQKGPHGAHRLAQRTGQAGKEGETIKKKKKRKLKEGGI